MSMCLFGNKQTFEVFKCHSELHFSIARFYLGAGLFFHDYQAAWAHKVKKARFLFILIDDAFVKSRKASHCEERSDEAIS